jgi:ribosomal protein S21
MTKKVDETQLVKDVHERMPYTEIALKHKISKSTIIYRLRKLGLKRNKAERKVFTVEEKYIISKMIETPGGRKQLLYILRGK